MNNIISVQGVSKVFKHQAVLQNVSVDFAEGGIYGLIGRNGSGKTMLIRCICGFVPPTSGEIFVHGKRVVYGSDFPKGIGFRTCIHKRETPDGRGIFPPDEAL